jgi:hypothetical protein
VSAGLKPNDVPVNEASLRDYFAAHAPAEIPEWFRHTSPNQTFPPMPDYLELDECHRKVALDWQRDPCFDRAAGEPHAGARRRRGRPAHGRRQGRASSSRCTRS